MPTYILYVLKIEDATMSDDNVKSIECKICGNKYYSTFAGREKKKLAKHLKVDHKMTSYEYVLTYMYDGNEPECACGCGKKTKYKKWKFDKYYLDHKNTVSPSKAIREKMSIASREKQKNNYKKLGLTCDQLKDYWLKYKESEYTQKHIRNISGVDFRTIRRYWEVLEIVKKEEINRYGRIHQFVYANQGDKNGSYVSIDKKVLDSILDYAERKMYANKPIYIYQVIRKFDLRCTKHVLEKRLTEIYGWECLKVFKKKGISSDEELEFKTILEHFFEGHNVIHGFRLENKVYDFLLYGKILLEFDGDFWHCGYKENHPMGTDYVVTTAKRDKEKNDIAKRNGYPIYRIWSSDSKDIESVFNLLREIKGRCIET